MEDYSISLFRVEKPDKYCDRCNKFITYSNFAAHRKSYKHVNFTEYKTKLGKKIEKIKCPCGILLLPVNMKKHVFSKRHREYIYNLE